MLKKAIVLMAGMTLSALVLAGSPVNINQADTEELASSLHGVGEAKAEAIVAYRDENGEFGDIDELVEVRGIGLRTVDQNRDQITVEDSEG